ncbi:MAG: four helix bundle protein [Bacteroidota bacterium]
MRDFRKLNIWKRSIVLAGKINTLSGKFPVHERYAIAVQMNKAAVSIPSNIAEGCGRRTQPDLIKFIHIAIGSAFELETQIEIAFLNNYINKTTHQNLIEELHELQKMMTGFIGAMKEEGGVRV